MFRETKKKRLKVAYDMNRSKHSKNRYNDKGMNKTKYFSCQL